MLEIGVLGDVRASIGGRALDLGGPRQRAVLAMLVSAGGRIVSTDRFVEDLWAGEPPPKALGALQAYVSHLRRLLEPGRAPRTPASVLVSAAPGYRLALDDEQVDAWDLLRLTDAARTASPADALALAVRARERWTGRPFAAYADEPWVGPESDRLVEAHATAAEIAGEAALTLGRPGVAVAALDHLVRAQPLRESAAALLARVLAAAGRPGDALALLRATRARLVDELGLDPGPALREAEATVLAPDASGTPRSRPARGAGRAPSSGRSGPPTRAAPPARTVPSVPVTDSDDAGFLGRAGELARLHRARPVGTDRAGVVWVQGEAGAGKSALVDRFAREASTDGTPVLRARCSEVGGAPSGWAWRDLHARLTGPVPASTEAFDLVAGLVHRVADGGTVVIEDVHRADGETLQVLRHLVTTVQAPVLVVATFRGDETGDDLRATLALLASRTADRLDLGGLDAESARRLVRRAAGRDLADRTWQALLARAAGNALFLAQLGRLARAEGDEVATRGLPAGIADLLDRRLARLPARTVGTLTHAAVLGREIDADLLLAVDALRAGDTEAELLDDLDAAVVAGLLEIDDGLPHRPLRFAHALVRDTVVARIPPLRRARLHTAALDVLETRRPLRPHALAHHAEWALTPTTAARTLGHLVAGATAAYDAGAVDDAVRWWRAALRAHDLGAGDAASRMRARRELVRALAAAGDLPGAAAERVRSIALAERTGDVTDVARAWAWDVVALWSTRSLLEEQAGAVARVRELLDLVDPADRALRAELLLALAHEAEPWLVDVGLPAGVEALAIARELGDPRLLCRALNVAHVYTFGDPDPDHQLRVGSEMLSVATAANLGDHRALAHLILSAAAVGRGDLAAARTHLDGATATAGAGQLPVLALSVTVFAATLDLVHGRVDAAREAFDQLTARITASGDPNAGFIRAWVTATVGAAAGDSSGAFDDVEAVDPTGVAVLRVLVRLDAGRAEEARALWPLPVYPREQTWLLETAIRCLAACRLDDAVTVRELRDDLRPWSGQLARTGNGQLVLGPVDLVLARAAITLGEDPTPSVRAAAELARRLDAPHWLADAEALLTSR